MQMADIASAGFAPAAGARDGDTGPGARDAQEPIGMVIEVSGAGSRVVLDIPRLTECASDPDPALALAGQVGIQIKVQAGTTWLLATVRSQRQDANSPEAIIAVIDFLGEGDADPTGHIANFRRGITNYPIPGAMVYPATTEDLRDIYASTGRAAIQVGSVFPTRDIPATLYIDALLGKHFALLGSTGTGKSTAAALILHRICEAAPEGHIVMIDPHGEYGAAFKDNGVILDVSNLQMPYWLMNFEEHCEVFVTTRGDERQEDAEILAKCLLDARMRNRLGQEMGKTTVDAPIPYLLSDLSAIINLEMGKLDKGRTTAGYMRLKNRIDEVRADPRYQFMFAGMLVGDIMAAFIGKLFRLPSRGRPISIIDVSGVPSEITATVVAVLSRLVFDFAVWAREEHTLPILLVCEEAHRYVPNERNADGSSVGRIMSRIAKEGRKYGVSLGLITQRPSDLAEGVLSQCGTIIAMRLNNDRDQAFVRAAMPEGSRGFLEAIPALRNRECVICGEGVSIPVRVGFDALEDGRRPASGDPLFSDLWCRTGGEDELIRRTVQRWRSGGR
jgi:hypothetical protein